MSAAEDIAFNKAQLAASAQTMRDLIRESQAGGVQALDAIGITVVNEVKRLLSKPGPSQPGEPPGYRTGRLRDSYQYAVGTEPIPYVDVGTNVVSDDGAPYPVFLEFGTSRMDARPHLRVAINRTVDSVPKIVASAVAKAQRAALTGHHSGEGTEVLRTLFETLGEE